LSEAQKGIVEYVEKYKTNFIRAQRAIGLGKRATEKIYLQFNCNILNCTKKELQDWINGCEQ